MDRVLKMFFDFPIVHAIASFFVLSFCDNKLDSSVYVVRNVFLLFGIF